MTLPRILVLLMFAAFALAPLRFAQAGVFNPETFTLRNGMQVVVLPNHRAPVVLHMVWYKAGSSDEPKGKSGVAHLLEHLMFKGTAQHPDGAFSRILAEHGGQENAFTNRDYTGYYQVVAADRLGLMMELEADRMTNLVLDPKDVVTERDVVLEERNQRIENEPAARLAVEADKKLYPKGHPYGRPIIGWREELASLNRDDALDFYKSHYAPDNAILVVAGDVDVADVKRLAEKHYGPIAPAHRARRDSLLVNGADDAGEEVLKDARVRQPAWSLSVLQPSYATGDAKRVAALEVLDEILGGGPTSKLYRALVVDQALAVSAGTAFDAMARADGRFIVYASPRDGIGLDDLANVVRKELDQVLVKGLDAGELDRVKGRLLTSQIFARDEMKTGAWTIGAALAADVPLAAVEDWPALIEAVTEQDVLDALKAVLTDPRRITTKLMGESGGGKG